ncbi:MAG TPA: DUF2085 domain-containing protein [Bryobacteraceae bacterium]
MGSGRAAVDRVQGAGAWTIAAGADGLAPLRQVVLACTAAALTAIALAPVAPAIRLAFSMVCHQSPARCLWWWGAPMPVCARCLGVYMGLFAASIRPLRAPAAALWAFTAATGFDWLFGLASNGPRCALALAFAWLAGSSLLASRKGPASH